MHPRPDQKQNHPNCSSRLTPLQKPLHVETSGVATALFLVHAKLLEQRSPFKLWQHPKFSHWRFKIWACVQRPFHSCSLWSIMALQVFSGTSAAAMTGAPAGGGMVGARGMTGTTETTGAAGVIGKTEGGTVGMAGMTGGWKWPLEGVSSACWACWTCSVGAGGRGADVKCLGRERPIRERLMG
jgi:hypothetical protein